MALVYNIGGPNPNFKDLNDIDSTTLTQGDNTIQIYPGTYTAPLGMVATDVSFKGMGDRDAVIIEANSALGMTIGNTSSGSITFENLTIKGQDDVVTGNPAGANTGITKLGAASTPLVFRNVKFINCEHAVTHTAERAFATTTDQVQMHYCQADVDKAIQSNSNVHATYTLFGANAYHTALSGSAPAIHVKTLLCGPNTANVGNATETIQATIA